MDARSLRLTARVLDYLYMGSLYQRFGDGHEFDATDLPVADSLVAKINDAPTRKDGSVTLRLTDAEIDMIRGYVEGMEMGGRDNAWDPDGRADYNAARALLNKIGRLSLSDMRR